jgi:hypothetical protein
MQANDNPISSYESQDLFPPFNQGGAVGHAPHIGPIKKEERRLVIFPVHRFRLLASQMSQTCPTAPLPFLLATSSPEAQYHLLGLITNSDVE